MAELPFSNENEKGPEVTGVAGFTSASPYRLTKSMVVSYAKAAPMANTHIAIKVKNLFITIINLVVLG